MLVADAFAELISMRKAYYSTGKLIDVFTMIDKCYQCDIIPELNELAVLIDEAHIELEQLLGTEAWRIYPS